MAAREKKPLSFEQRLEKVTETIDRLESGASTLEETLRDYEQATILLSELEQELTSAQQRLTILRKRADGAEQEEAWEEET